MYFERIKMSGHVLSVGVCLEDILKFMNFYEIKKFSRVCRTWSDRVHRSPDLQVICDYVGFSAPRPVELARKIPRFCEQLRLDVRHPTEAKDVLEAALNHRSLRLLHVLHRRTDGSVLLPKLTAGGEGLEVVLQFPLNNELAAVLSQHGERITRLVVVETVADEDVLTHLMQSLVNVRALHLGYVTDEVDFDVVSKEVMKLKHLRSFDASDMNVSLETLSKLKAAGKIMFNPLLDLLHL